MVPHRQMLPKYRAIMVFWQRIDTLFAECAEEPFSVMPAMPFPSVIPAVVGRNLRLSS
jgi:hypothetical protein